MHYVLHFLLHAQINNTNTFAENVAIFLSQQARVQLLVTQQTCETQHMIHLQHVGSHVNPI